MKLHFPETWKIGTFHCVTSGPLEFWRGVHNVRWHLEGKTFLNVYNDFLWRCNFLGWARHTKCHLLLWGPPSMVFPVWKQEKKATFKTRLMEAFPNNPNVDGWVARKCNLQFASPHIPWSQHNLFQFWDAQQGCTTVWTPSTWCLNTKHVMGWDENANPLSGQSKRLENQ